jgi:hypothetical protein
MSVTDTKDKWNKTTWIYKLTKGQLQEELNKLNIDYNGDSATVDELRQLLVKYCKDQQENEVKQKKGDMANVNLQAFDGDKWETFEQQFECCITLHEIAEEKKVPLLLTKLTPPVFETLTLLCAPNKPTSLPYPKLVDLLKNKYVKQQSVFLERAAFRGRNQMQNEKIEDYALELRRLAGKCAFKDMDEQIKEKLVDGVCSKVVKFELLKANADMTLENIITLARTVEAALLESNNTKYNPGTPEVYYQQRENDRPMNNKRFIKGKPNISRQIRCYCCGNDNHIRTECRLKKKYCSECGQQGHIFKVCPKKRAGKINFVEKEENEMHQPECGSSDEYQMYSVNVSKVPPHFLELNVESKSVNFQLDTGSDVTVIPLQLKEDLFPCIDIKKCNIRFRNFDQTVSQPVGILENLTVKFNDITKQLNVFVTKNSPCIIGRDWLKELMLWPPTFITNNMYTLSKSVNNVSEARAEIKERFAEVFSPGWGNFKGETISLKLKPEAKPKSLPVRRVPFALQDKVKAEITRLLQNGRIEPVETSQWGTPVVPILKGDGSVRLCGDYKLTVNPHLEVDHFPLPHIEDIFNSLNNGEYFCELDLKEAYHQAPLDEGSKDCTVIVTESGTFRYNYLPYGVSTGPGSFQRLMSKKLLDIPNTAVFIDNIYI